MAEEIYNKYKTEIDSRKDIEIGQVRLPDASKHIMEGKANKNDISRICKGIAEAFKSQELLKSREREQAIAETIGIDI